MTVLHLVWQWTMDDVRHDSVWSRREDAERRAEKLNAEDPLMGCWDVDDIPLRDTNAPD